MAKVLYLDVESPGATKYPNWYHRNTIFWYCPGCKEIHSIPANSPSSVPQKNWAWNGDSEQPIITPSINISWTGWSGDDEDEEERTAHTYRCHSFVQKSPSGPESVVNYCDDCTHGLAGQMIPMRDVRWKT